MYSTTSPQCAEMKLLRAVPPNLHATEGNATVNVELFGQSMIDVANSSDADCSLFEIFREFFRKETYIIIWAYPEYLSEFVSMGTRKLFAIEVIRSIRHFKEKFNRLHLVGINKSTHVEQPAYLGLDAQFFYNLPTKALLYALSPFQMTARKINETSVVCVSHHQ